MLIFDVSSSKALAIAEKAFHSARRLHELKIHDAAVERAGHGIHLLGLAIKEYGMDDELNDLSGLVVKLEEALVLLRTVILNQDAPS